MSQPETVVENPTYMGEVRHFFEDLDIDHMRGFGIELGTYQGVMDNAFRIYARTSEGTMPPEPDRKWSAERVQTFYNWMKNGYPRGEAAPAAPLLMAAEAPAASRVRRNLKELGPDEIDKVKRALAGMMALPPEDTNSFFHLAGLHWLPGKPPLYYCRHHENAYNPWHRAYLMTFENAMRSIPGCEDVTLPYWDISDSEIPAMLYEPPFASFTLPEELVSLDGSTTYPKGMVTQRYDAATVLSKLAETGVPANIVSALGFSHWEMFNGWDAGRTQTGIIKAHDNGHNSCGVTMQNQDVAAFDPIFFFFHCNWDRLWWKWQRHYNATTLNTFLTHIAGESGWLTDPVLNPLVPFGVTAKDMIDLSSMDVDYEDPVGEAPPQGLKRLHASLRAAEAPALAALQKVSVRLKDVNRLEIPGSFHVYLHVGDRQIGKDGLFQPSTPKQCGTCRKHGLASFDFLVRAEDLTGGPISASIAVLRPDGTEEPFPLSRAGDPTINVRLLLEP